MDAGLFDVLHDPAEHDGSRLVGDRIDVELERVLDELIDQHRMFWRRIDGARHVPIERAHVVHDRHAARPDGPLQLDASVGIACFPTDGNDPDTLLAHADRAMYASKRQTPGRRTAGVAPSLDDAGVPAG